MKKIMSSLLIVAAFSTTTFSQTKAAEVARFNTERIQMGKLKQGEPATATFTVTNTGSKPLLIEKTMPSCSCTTPEYTKTPIAPGKTGIVKATYNAGSAGSFNKTVYVRFAGVEKVSELTISGEVEAAKAVVKN
jgi:P pilus assembly chaperone PapD